MITDHVPVMKRRIQQNAVELSLQPHQTITMVKVALAIGKVARHIVTGAFQSQPGFITKRHLSAGAGLQCSQADHPVAAPQVQHTGACRQRLWQMIQEEARTNIQLLLGEHAGMHG